MILDAGNFHRAFRQGFCWKQSANIGKGPTMANEGFFVDWNGKARSTLDPGGDAYMCEVDAPARYVAVMSKTGALVHEATFYNTLEDIAKAGIKAEFVPGSHPWGRPDEGF
jgi:hypothetical protein